MSYNRPYRGRGGSYPPPLRDSNQPYYSSKFRRGNHSNVFIPPNSRLNPTSESDYHSPNHPSQGRYDNKSPNYENSYAQNSGSYSPTNPNYSQMSSTPAYSPKYPTQRLSNTYIPNEHIQRNSTNRNTESNQSQSNKVYARLPTNPSNQSKQSAQSQKTYIKREAIEPTIGLIEAQASSSNLHYESDSQSVHSRTSQTSNNAPPVSNLYNRILSSDRNRNSANPDRSTNHPYSSNPRYRGKRRPYSPSPGPSSKKHVPIPQDILFRKDGPDAPIPSHPLKNYKPNSRNISQRASSSNNPNIDSLNKTSPERERNAPLLINNRSIASQQNEPTHSLSRRRPNVDQSNSNHDVYNELLRPMTRQQTVEESNPIDNRQRTNNNNNNVQDFNPKFALVKEEWKPPNHLSMLDFVGPKCSFLYTLENQLNVRMWRDSNLKSIFILGTQIQVTHSKVCLEKRVAQLELDEDEGSSSTRRQTRNTITRSPPRSENRQRKLHRLTARENIIAQYKQQPAKPNPCQSYFMFPANVLETVVFGEDLNFLDEIIFAHKVNVWYCQDSDQLMVSAPDQHQHDQAYDKISRIYDLYFNGIPSLKPTFLLYITSNDVIVLRKPYEKWLLNYSSSQVSMADCTQPSSPGTPDRYDYNMHNHSYTANQIQTALTPLKAIPGKIKLRICIGKVIYKKTEPKQLRSAFARQVLENFHADSQFGYFHHNISPLSDDIQNLRQKSDESFTKQSIREATEYTFRVLDVNKSVYKFTCTFKQDGKATVSPYYQDDIYPVRVYHSTPKEPFDYMTEIQVNQILEEPTRFLKKFSDSIQLDSITQNIIYTNNMAISLKEVVKKQKYFYHRQDYDIVITQYFKYNFQYPELGFGQPYDSIQKTLSSPCNESGFSMKIIKDCWNDLGINHSLKSGNIANWNTEELFNKKIAFENHNLCTNAAWFLVKNINFS